MDERGSIEEFVLHEARLGVGRIAAARAAVEQANDGEIPLLMSIENEQDCAVLVPVRAGETYGGLVTGLRRHMDLRRPAQHYLARYVDQMSLRDASHFRLAVTESGINESATPLATQGAPSVASFARGDRPSSQMLWIGAPQDTHAGLLLLVGNSSKPVDDPAAGSWPMPLSAALRVRIYAGSRL